MTEATTVAEITNQKPATRLCCNFGPRRLVA